MCILENREKFTQAVNSILGIQRALCFYQAPKFTLTTSLCESDSCLIYILEMKKLRLRISVRPTKLPQIGKHKSFNCNLGFLALEPTFFALFHMAFLNSLAARLALLNLRSIDLWLPSIHLCQPFPS